MKKLLLAIVAFAALTGAANAATPIQIAGVVILSVAVDEAKANCPSIDVTATKARISQLTESFTTAEKEKVDALRIAHAGDNDQPDCTTIKMVFNMAAAVQKKETK